MVYHTLPLELNERNGTVKMYLTVPRIWRQWTAKRQHLETPSYFSVPHKNKANTIVPFPTLMFHLPKEKKITGFL